MVACSGGPDSVALAYALKDLQRTLEFAVEIAHVNHKLRGVESDNDEKFVSKLAKSLGWKCQVARAAVKSVPGNREEAARDLRYAALLAMAKRRRCDAVFTAHTLDDLVETVLMNLMRGSGPDGLAGMAPIRALAGTKIALVRPLLDVDKAELKRWLIRSNRQFRMDRSNRNYNLFRNWVRAKIVPMMERKAPGFKARIRRLADIALDEKLHWEQEIDLLEKRLLKPVNGGRLLDLGGLLRYSPAVQRRFLRRSLGRDVLNYEAIERLRNWMRSSPTGGRVWQLRKGWVVERLSKSKGSPSARMFMFKSPVGKEKIHS